MGTFRSDDHDDHGRGRGRDATEAALEDREGGVISAAETEAQADLAWERFAARVRSGEIG